MTEEVLALLRNADRALDAARILVEHGMKQDAANRIYYAMFYAAQALLRHHGVIRPSNPPWVITSPVRGKWPPLFIACLSTPERSENSRTTVF